MIRDQIQGGYKCDFCDIDVSSAARALGHVIKQLLQFLLAKGFAGLEFGDGEHVLFAYFP